MDPPYGILNIPDWDKEAFARVKIGQLLDTFLRWANEKQSSFPCFQYCNEELFYNFNLKCKEIRVPTQTLGVVKAEFSTNGPRYAPKMTLVASAWFPSQEKVRWIDFPSNSKDRSNLFHAPMPKFHRMNNGERVNLTEKSVEVETQWIHNHCDQNKVVVSLFSGSGTTAESALRCGRSSISFDTDFTQLNYTFRRLVDTQNQLSEVSIIPAPSAASSSTEQLICATCSFEIINFEGHVLCFTFNS